MAGPRLGSIYRRKKNGAELSIWWLKYSRNGQVFRESSRTAEYAEAERLLKRRLGEIVTGKFQGLGAEQVRLAPLFDDLIEDYRVNGRHSLPDTKLRIRRRLLPVFAQIRAADLSTGRVKRYIAGRLKAGAAPGTVKRELIVLKRALNVAAKSDPPRIAHVPHIPLLKDDHVRAGFLEYSDYLSLCRQLPEYLKLLLVVGYHVGARRGELLPLRYDQVDLPNDGIRLEPGTTKSGEARALPIYGDMREWLKIAKEIRDRLYPECPYVFHRAGRPIHTTSMRLGGLPASGPGRPVCYFTI